MYYFLSKLRSCARLRLCQLCAIVSLCIMLMVTLKDNAYSNKALPVSQSTVNSGDIPILHRHINKILFKRRATFLPSIRDKYPNSVRILCYILISRAKVKAGQVIKETWGSHCDELIFFGGFEYPDLPVVKLNITEGYENLWGKTKAAILYLSANIKYKVSLD